MAGIYVNDNGAWKLPKSIWVNDGTSTTGATGWRVCQNVYVNRNGAWQEMIRSVTLSSSQSNFNLWNYVGSPTAPLSLIFNISSGVEITSSSSDNLSKSIYRTTAFTVGNFPSGSSVIINNNGYISGGGGFGGRGADYVNGRNFDPASNGYPGGVGISKSNYKSNNQFETPNNYDCTIVNTGTIAGGGGGGGGGQGYMTPSSQWNPGRWVAGNIGGQGAGITGGSRTQGGSPMTTPAVGVPSVPNTVSGGFGGALGEPGLVNKAPGVNQRTGGAGGRAIAIAGIDLAVSGTIIGVVG